LCENANFADGVQDLQEKWERGREGERERGVKNAD
jgi:hypothetical protein